MIVSVVSLTALLGGIGLWIWLGAWWWFLVGFAGLFLLGAAGAFAYLYFMCACVDTSVPQEHDDPHFRRLFGLYADAIVSVLGMHVEARGLEKTPKEGRFLLVCNHTYELDPVVLESRFKRSQLSFISKRENSSMLIVGQLMHRTMCQLINRENDREALKTILKCIQLLKDDEVSIAVFPEGYINKERRLQRFRSGSLKIATKAKVPIVVCTLQGTDKVVNNLKHLRPSRIQLHLLDVITPEQQAGRTAVELGEQIYQMMAADLGPDYAPLEEENP